MCPASEISQKLLVQVPDIGARHDICLLKMNSVEVFVLTTEAFICFFVREDLRTELPGVKQLKRDSVHLVPFLTFRMCGGLPHLLCALWLCTYS